MNMVKNLGSFLELAVCTCFSNNVFLIISQHSHRRTPVLESPFNKIAGLKACNFIKKRVRSRCFLVNISNILKDSFFYRTPPVAAFVLSLLIDASLH